MPHSSFKRHFPRRQISDSPKMKQLADDNFEENVNGGKFSEKVENTVGKGEIARYKPLNFSFSHRVLKRLVSETRKNQGFVWESVKDSSLQSERKALSKVDSV